MVFLNGSRDTTCTLHAFVFIALFPFLEYCVVVVMPTIDDFILCVVTCTKAVTCRKCFHSMVLHINIFLFVKKNFQSKDILITEINIHPKLY